MLNQRLQQKLLQKLSPQQIQLIKLLEIPSMQLDQRIKKEIEENPALEMGTEKEEDEQTEVVESTNDDEFTLEDYLNEEDAPSYKLMSKNYSANDKKVDMPHAAGIDFKENLKNQLRLQNISDEDEELVNYLIGSIDDDGFLRRPIENIVDDLAFNLNIITTDEKVEELLMQIQELDPAGVGARNLQECLLIQIKRKERESKALDIATTILEEYFDAFTKKHYDKIIKRLDITEEDLKEANQEIIKLNPKPGSAYSDPAFKGVQQITPDFTLETVDGDLVISLNQANAPELHVSRSYSDMLIDYSKNKANKSREQKDAVTFIRQKLDSAKWFIDAVKQRQNTLLSTMNTIVQFQKEFFFTGDETKLRPMILKDIADITKLDISTISRVASSKYIQTDFGIYSLKYFFSEAMKTTSGEDVSSREIKSIIQKLIDEEDKKKPLTDEALMNALHAKEYKIARRTVAKYREQLNIPVGRLRKEL